MITHNMPDYWPTNGWHTSSPEKQAMNSAFIQPLETYIQNTRPHLNTLLIIRHGHIVFEYYAPEYNQHSYQMLHSMTKSFISALVGIALQRGYLKSLDQRWSEFFPDYFTSDTNPRNANITIRHLLKMTSGLNPDALAYPGRRGDNSQDWMRFALETPTLLEPNTLFMYSSLGSHLLSMILSKTSNMSTLEFARHFLFAPLGITSDSTQGFAWETDPQGYHIGGAGLSLTACDSAKLGYLFLHNGQWEGSQLISSPYIEEATQVQSSGGHPEATPYGYHWWIEDLNGQHSFYAAGFGGQYIQVFPQMDLVLVYLAPDHPALGLYHRQLIPLAFVLPAIQHE
jgi:CubicO group peptidase (beta-lactamase class C family)